MGKLVLKGAITDSSAEKKEKIMNKLVHSSGGDRHKLFECWKNCKTCIPHHNK